MAKKVVKFLNLGFSEKISKIMIWSINVFFYKKLSKPWCGLKMGIFIENFQGHSRNYNCGFLRGISRAIAWTINGDFVRKLPGQSHSYKCGFLREVPRSFKVDLKNLILTEDIQRQFPRPQSGLLMRIFKENTRGHDP